MHETIRARVKAKHDIKGGGSNAEVGLWLHEYHSVTATLFKEAVVSIYPVLVVGGTYLFEDVEVRKSAASPGLLEVVFHKQAKAILVAAPPAPAPSAPKPAATPGFWEGQRVGTHDLDWARSLGSR